MSIVEYFGESLGKVMAWVVVKLFPEKLRSNTINCVRKRAEDSGPVSPGHVYHLLRDAKNVGDAFYRTLFLTDRLNKAIVFGRTSEGKWYAKWDGTYVDNPAEDSIEFDNFAECLAILDMNIIVDVARDGGLEIDTDGLNAAAKKGMEKAREKFPDA